MKKVQEGDNVRVHYTGSFEDGTVFDTSREGEPLEFEVGSGRVISGFETAVVGLGAGETTKVTIPPAEAYGEYIDEMTFSVNKDQMPQDLDPEPGMMLQVTGEDGQVAHLTVKEVGEAEVILDGNHPMAGKTLVFDIELVEVD